MAIQSPGNETKIANMFNRIAPRYDFLNALLSAKQDKRWRKSMISMAPFRPNGKLLDVATGTGDVLIEAMSQHKEYSEFYGTDISKQMLSIAKNKVQNLEQSEKSQFSLMSAESLKLPDSTFDCLTISFGLRNVVRREVAINEFNRVLKPGGSLLILEFFIPKRGPLARLFQFYFHQILPVIGGIFSDKSAYKYLPESVGSFYEYEELRDVLYSSGFVINQSKKFLFGSCRIVNAIKS
jgi:demethylmenaquinone methyltransferase / 2-methoxy-6-polyprenyl-1,4-benzoquinol methylase